MIRDYIQIAYANLKQRSLRSWITTFGVVISVAAIVILVLVSNGLQLAIEDQFAKMGSNRIFVSSGAGQPGFRTGLVDRDVETAEKLGDFKFVTPSLMEPSAEVEYSKEKHFAMITGYPVNKADERFASYDLKFASGRPFTDGEKNGAILADLAANDFFEKDIGLRNSIYINGRKFTVIGILAPIGNSEDDSQIMIPLETARELFNKPDGVSVMDLEVKEGVDIDQVAARLERQLERDRDDENFRIMTPTQILKILGNVMSIVQGILVSIAGISLLVGAVGIMNMMFTSVLERTKEIGVMKSVGARNRDVLLIFMVEAGFIGLSGGVLGVLIGVVISLGIGAAAAASGFALLKIVIDPTVVVGGIVFATVVGVVSGYMPARRAAYLHPVDALRWQ
ncbi:MAG: ABC transporter permease [Candidatus Nanoarchaeia archaeon]